MDTLDIILFIAIVAAVAAIATMLSQNAGKMQQITSLKDEINHRDEEKQIMQKAIAERDAAIAASQATITMLENQASEARNQMGKYAEQIESLNERIITLSNENSKYNERLTVAANERARLQHEAQLQFGELATKIFDEKTRKSDDRLNEILSPLKENIERLKKEITERSIKDTENHASLREQIGLLRDLNTQIGKDATYLANALKGNNSVQGNWGEQMLENILSASGLIKGEQFEVQVTKDEAGNTFTNDAGNRLRPDVIVHLPDNKDIIIDSKVSFRAYIDYVNATDERTQQEKLKEHATSVKKHVDELATKSYQDYVRKSGDFVMMFIPNEGAYLAAMHADAHLWEYAYDKRVVIISPTHLISVLKLVSQLWGHDKQTKNALKIAEEAGKLYDRFVEFVEYMRSIDKGIAAARQAYDKAMAKLQDGRGNILRQVENLQELGAKAKKKLQLPAE